MYGSKMWVTHRNNAGDLVIIKLIATIGNIQTHGYEGVLSVP